MTRIKKGLVFVCDILILFGSAAFMKTSQARMDSMETTQSSDPSYLFLLALFAIIAIDAVVLMIKKVRAL